MVGGRHQVMSCLIMNSLRGILLLLVHVAATKQLFSFWGCPSILYQLCVLKWPAKIAPGRAPKRDTPFVWWSDAIKRVLYSTTAGDVVTYHTHSLKITRSCSYYRESCTGGGKERSRKNEEDYN